VELGKEGSRADRGELGDCACDRGGIRGDNLLDHQAWGFATEKPAEVGVRDGASVLWDYVGDFDHVDCVEGGTYTHAGRKCCVDES